MPHYALVVNLDLCTGCMSCEISCKMENNVNLGQYWNKTLRYSQGTFPDTKQFWLPTMCQQCENAPCVNVCPTGASYRNEDNIVLVNKERCIGCRYCMMACPYGVRSWNEDVRAVEKCTLCNHLTSVGEDPACVKNCSSKCRYYGDLDDPNSDASKAIAAAAEGTVHNMKDVGNHPVSRYILTDRIGEWEWD